MHWVTLYFVLYFQNGVLNFSPKHGISLRNEVCVIMFKKESENIYATLMETLVKQLDNIRLAVRPFMAVEGQDSLRHLPYSKIFLVFAECLPNKRPASPSSPTSTSVALAPSPSSPSCPTSLQTKTNEQVELQIASLKVIKALGGKPKFLVTQLYLIKILFRCCMLTHTPIRAYVLPYMFTHMHICIQTHTRTGIVIVLI